MTISKTWIGAAFVFTLALQPWGVAVADVSEEPQEHGAHQQDFVHGAPQVQSLE